MTIHKYDPAKVLITFRGVPIADSVNMFGEPITPGPGPFIGHVLGNEIAGNIEPPALVQTTTLGGKPMAIEWTVSNVENSEKAEFVPADPDAAGDELGGVAREPHVKITTDVGNHLLVQRYTREQWDEWKAAVDELFDMHEDA